MTQKFFFIKGGDKYDELGISGNDGRSRNFRIAFWIRCSYRFNFVGRLALEANSKIIFDLPLDKLQRYQAKFVTVHDLTEDLSLRAPPKTG